MIDNGKKVKFHYVGKLASGELFDSSEGKEPLEFEVGKGMIIPGLEKEIVKMGKGDKKAVSVDPSEAYGDERPNLVQEVPKGKVPKGLDIKEGSVLYLKTSDGHTFPAKVKEIKEHTLLLDFNHPLAGKKLIFDVEVVDIN